MDSFTTLHGLIANLTEYLNLTPEQQFRVTAKIKRLIHVEKADLCHRLSSYAEGAPIYVGQADNFELVGREEPPDPFIYKTLVEKYEGHAKWALLPDDKVVTWDIGTHKYVQERSPCSLCDKSLIGDTEGYVTEHFKGKSTTYCKDCAIKNGKWDV